MTTPLKLAFEEAMHHHNFHPEYHDTENSEAGHRMQLPFTTAHQFDIRNTSIWELFDPASGDIKTAPFNNAVKDISIEKALLQRSVAAKLGAVMIFGTHEPDEITERGLPTFSSYPINFSVFRPAPMVEVISGDVIPISDVPFCRSTIDSDNTEIVAFATRIPRWISSVPGQTHLLDEAMRSLVAGIAQAMDRKIIETIKAAPLSAFGIQSAIAQGLQYESLGAVSSASATGLYIDQLGKLRTKSGIMTSVSDQFTGIGSIVGAWNRVALFVDPEVAVHLTNDKDGSIVLTTIIYVKALLPDPSLFWSEL